MAHLPEDEAGAAGNGAAAPGGFTAQETERLKALARERFGPARIDWPAATPPPAELLERLGPRLHPETGMPLGRDYRTPGQKAPPVAELELPAQRDFRVAQEYERYVLWAQLPAQQKTALAAHARWGAEEGPYWLVQLVAVGNAPDSGVPPVVLRAPSGPEARDRYLRLCGVISFDAGGQQLLASPYAPAGEGGAG
jgi:hypothetical protein